MHIKVIYLFCFLFVFLPLNINACPVINDKTDSLQTSNSISDSNYIPVSQFTWAGDRRYTISGEQPRINTQFKPVTAAIIGGVTLTSIVVLHIAQQNASEKFIAEH